MQTISLNHGPLKRETVETPEVWKLVKRNHLQVFHVFCLSLASCFAFTFMEKLTKTWVVQPVFSQEVKSSGHLVLHVSWR